MDGAPIWSDAKLGETVSPYALRSWTFLWNAAPGAHMLCMRATDAAGNVQPMERQWNFGGYGNNGVQQVKVIVE